MLTLLGIVLIVLKLAHVIAWSWWIVTLPLWIGLVVLFVGGSLVGMGALVLRRIFK